MIDDIGGKLDEIFGGIGAELISTVAVILVAVVVIWFTKRAIQRWSHRVNRRYVGSDDHADRERGQRLVTLTAVMLMVVRMIVWMVVVLTTMGIWGIPMTPLIAVATTIGVAIGFGAQDLVKDIIGGFFILVEDQFGIGDVVSISGVSGTVEAIKLRTTVLRDIHGNEHHVPNGHITVTSNMTPDVAKLVADVAVSYGTDVDRAIEVILDEATTMAHDPDWLGVFLGAPEMLGVNSLGESSVEIRVQATVITEERWTVKREFNRRIKNRLDAEGIEIPFNYLSVVLQNDDE
ncbi:MAG: mechanosensitive ion channel family protein [Actinomycetota bacterium]